MPSQNGDAVVAVLIHGHPVSPDRGSGRCRRQRARGAHAGRLWEIGRPDAGFQVPRKKALARNAPPLPSFHGCASRCHDDTTNDDNALRRPRSATAKRRDYRRRRIGAVMARYARDLHERRVSVGRLSAVEQPRDSTIARHRRLTAGQGSPEIATNLQRVEPSCSPGAAALPSADSPRQSSLSISSRRSIPRHGPRYQNQFPASRRPAWIERACAADGARLDVRGERATRGQRLFVFAVILLRPLIPRHRSRMGGAGRTRRPWRFRALAGRAPWAKAPLHRC